MGSFKALNRLVDFRGFWRHEDIVDVLDQIFAGRRLRSRLVATVDGDIGYIFPTELPPLATMPNIANDTRLGLIFENFFAHFESNSVEAVAMEMEIGKTGGKVHETLLIDRDAVTEAGEWNRSSVEILHPVEAVGLRDCRITLAKP